MKGVFYSPIVSAKTPFISPMFFFFPYFYRSQPIENLYTQIANLGFASGLYSIDKTTSDSTVWNLKITNKEMKEVYLGELASAFGLAENYKTILGHLACENYFEGFGLLVEELKNCLHSLLLILRGNNNTK